MEMWRPDPSGFWLNPRSWKGDQNSTHAQFREIVLFCSWANRRCGETSHFLWQKPRLSSEGRSTAKRRCDLVVFYARVEGKRHLMFLGKKKGTSCFPQSFSCLKKLMTADLQMDNIFHVKYVEWDEEVNWQYGGNLLGYPQFSSVLDWDFPWHQPSSSWGNPHGELKPPRIFHFRTSAGWSDFRYNQQASNPQSFP